MKLKHVVDQNGFAKTVVIEKVQFNKKDITEYKELFHNMVNNNYIIADSFEASTWQVYNFIANIYQSITFDLDVYIEIQLSLKCYVTAQLTIGKRWDTVFRNARFIKEIVFSTNGLKDITQYEKYISSLLKSDQRKCYLSSHALINFLTFYKVKDGDRFTDISNSVKGTRTKNRDLPDFHDVVNFDSIINQYFRDTPIESHIKYKPIQLWWSLTNIIPMRPSEFMLVAFDCVEKDSDDLCWITVPRIKDDTDSPDEVITLESLRYQTFQISHEMFNIISEFKVRLLQMNIDSQFLFSLQFYTTTYESKASRKSTAINDRMNSNQFRQLLLKFNKHIVLGLYNERFEMNIVPSHTRHFAIINMFLQGFNLLSIAKLAGHLDLRTADNYYSHAKDFAKSYVYNFVTTNMGQNIGRKMSDGLIGWRREVIDKGKMYKQEDTLDFLKVDYGFCKDKLFPNNCGEHCGPCPFFIFKPSINGYDRAIEWLENYSKNLEIDIDLVLESMIETSKSLNDLFTPNKEEAFSSKARELQAYLDHKIRTDLLLSGLKE
jgi:hypothetical protein